MVAAREFSAQPSVGMVVVVVMMVVMMMVMVVKIEADLTLVAVLQLCWRFQFKVCMKNAITD